MKKATIDDGERLARAFRRMFKCDTARISSPLGKTKFLIIGHNRSTKEDGGVSWRDENGRRMDWDYVLETCVASGDTEAALMGSARRYKELLGISMARLLREEAGVR